MSNKDLARRTAAEVFFGGGNITSSLTPYLISITYTDNEEDESDDLQIKLHDREEIWTNRWLNAAVNAAASTAAPTGASGASETMRKVTAKSGLNVRSGAGTAHSVLGTLASGATVAVTGTENGWASIAYDGKTAYVSASYLEPVGSDQKERNKDQHTDTGLRIQAVIVRENWHGDGKDVVLDCGQFELDAVESAGPPATITIKATSLPYSAQVRQTLKSKAWESCQLSDIAKEKAAINGMTCMYQSDANPYYERVEQFQISDIAFLSKLCHDAGISLKATNNILVLFDQVLYEGTPPAVTIKRGSSPYTSYKLSTGKADTQYTSCRVSCTDPSTGKVIEATAFIADYKEDSKNNQQLEVTAKVNSAAEAKTLAEKRLRLHNKYEKTASFTMPGNPALLAGIAVQLSGWGGWDGSYMIKQAKHTVSSGYKVQIQLRRVLEGY